MIEQAVAITVCVDFSDLLAVTLPRNAKHFRRVFVVSSHWDAATKAVVSGVKNAELYTTNAFYRSGAIFNKGAAIEEAFDVAGRSGWLCVMDADILLPADVDLSGAVPGRLYTPRRRMLRDVTKWLEFVDSESWGELPMHAEEEFAGYFQFFHAGDPVLVERPWYGVTWRHAGGCDSEFQQKWGRSRQVRPPFEVLHLGEDGRNWCGRVTPTIRGETHPDAAARAEQLAKFIEGRRRRRDHGHEKLT